MSGWDISLDEAEMYECVNGHTFCREHVLKTEDYDEEYDYDPYEMAEGFCPLCNFDGYISDHDLITYLLKAIERTRTEIIEDVHHNFNSYTEFQEAVKA